jgi:methylmalonyl-CoA mutase cobalamin-binding domain/chain
LTPWPDLINIRPVKRLVRSHEDSDTMSEQSVGTPDGPIRVLTAKVGLDGHDRGVKIISRALRDAGMEVIYSGLHRTPEEIVATAIQEDVDVIGLSILSGAHMTLLPRILELLKEHEVLDRFIVVGGGVMPDEDVEVLKAMGVRDILGQDTPPDYIAVRIRELVADRGPRA